MAWLWDVARSSNARAVDNARAATTELSRLRVEREDVELFLAGLQAPVAVAHSPAHRPA